MRDGEALLAGDRGVRKQLLPLSGWRVQATQALRAVIDPQELEWTNNAALSDAEFAGRGFQMLKNNLQR